MNESNIRNIVQSYHVNYLTVMCLVRLEYTYLHITIPERRQISLYLSICSISGQSLITRKAVSIDRIFMGKRKQPLAKEPGYI